MSAAASIPLRDYNLTAGELTWAMGVFTAVRAKIKEYTEVHGGGPALLEVVRDVLGRPEHTLPTPMDLTGSGPFRGGVNDQGRYVAFVVQRGVELHTHNSSRSDQIPLYAMGETVATVYEPGKEDPILVPIQGGDHFHNAPGQPHSFAPVDPSIIGQKWEIGFLAITGRSLAEDTQKPSDAARAGFRKLMGYEAPRGGPGA